MDRFTHAMNVSTPLDVCEARDPKGLYKQPRRGDIPNMTGINRPYEAPLAPASRVGDGESVDEQVVRVLRLMGARQ
ncbi:adenylyl-sulfate kinase [Paraburkholderia adhaesiva]|uniref:adenylyl-sulfate kinase n=1 Tax=Paraburkholderia adhaesiva TaxID=2883244 RepID=UPI0027E43847|nr:adenylyl-sulfate kinase [Paraburkholderia adhaesiva]